MNTIGRDLIGACLQSYETNHNREGVNACTDQLLNILKQFPGLAADAQSSEKLQQLVNKLYSQKEHLPPVKQVTVTKIFDAIHHLRPKNIEGLSKIDLPAKVFIQKHTDVKAILYEGQKYPIAARHLTNSEMPCNIFFKSIPISLEDDTTVNVSQGMLAQFSKKFNAQLKDHEKDPDNLSLNMNQEHFEILIAFMNTDCQALINENNVLALLQSGINLEMPSVIEACENYLMRNPTHITASMTAALLNQLDQENDCYKFIQNHFAQFLQKGLSQLPISEQFLADLALIKQQLNHSLVISIGDSTIENGALKHLEGLPIHRLHLLQCPNLTKDCLSIISLLPTIKTLHVGGNDWVDDEALKYIPKNINILSLSGCKNFGMEGLINLQNSNVQNLDLSFCKQLRDEDLMHLPNVNTLSLRSCTDIEAKALKRLGELNQLQHLDLTNSKIKSELVNHLPNLKTLNLSGCAVTDTGLQALSQKQSLSDLTLSGPFTDKGFSFLPVSLERLRIFDCPNLSDQGIELLVGRPKLKNLQILRCPKITRFAIQKFAPDLIKVEWQAPPLSKALKKPPNLKVQSNKS